MIWLTGILAITLMLAILELDPSQLYSLSYLTYQVAGERWQFAADCLWAVVALLILLSYLTQRWLTQHKVKFAAPPPPTANVDPLETPASLNSTSSSLPSSAVKTKNFLHHKTFRTVSTQSLLTVISKAVIMLFILTAILCSSVAQRLALIESSPQKVIYIEATVTPVGLSDKRLQIDEQQEVQGYRQLVELSDIRLNSWVDNQNKVSEQGLVIADGQLLNPFLTNPAYPSTIHHTIPQADSQRLANPKRDTSRFISELPSRMTVLLQSFQISDVKLNQLSPDRQLQMTLALQPLKPKNTDNTDEFDEYRWLSSRHATAKATIVKANYQGMSDAIILTSQQKVDVTRHKFREHFLQLMNQRSQLANPKNIELSSVQQVVNQDAVAVTLSLLTGDRSLISKEMTALYRFAGISHLLAISGTHVLFLSLLCATLVTGMINYLKPSLYYFIPRWQCAFVTATFTAFGYTLFAGFDVPALRTACMLLMVGVMRYFLAVPAIFKMLLLLAVLMAVADVFVLWQAGFWLSFIAVIVLVAFSQRWQQGEKNDLTLMKGVMSKLVMLFKLQLWMSIALLPISLWLFGKVSLWGFLVNLFAIGLFGWIIVPLNLLASVMFVLIPKNAISDLIWSILFWLLDKLHLLLQLIQHTFQQTGWLYTDMSLPLLGLLVLLALPWMLPKSVLSYPLSVLPLLAIAAIGHTNKNHHEDSVVISVLNTKDYNYAATLVQYQQQSWLLLSAYHKSYKNAANKNKELSLKQHTKLAQNLYDQLKKHQVSQLTGAIVQTQTAKLAPVIAQLNQYMPISYYWQAGLLKHKNRVDEALVDTSLQAQSCEAGEIYPASLIIDQTKNTPYSQALSLKALTGWEAIPDSRVWDCVIEVSSPKLIYLKQQGERQALFPAIDSIPSIISSVESEGRVEQNKAVIYTSAEPQLAKLWPLICDVQIHPRSLWLTPSQSVVDKTLIDNFAPQHWEILGESHTAASLSLKESYLYWQHSRNE